MNIVSCNMFKTPSFCGNQQSMSIKAMLESYYNPSTKPAQRREIKKQIFNIIVQDESLIKKARLTPAQVKVISLYGQGMSAKEIADSFQQSRYYYDGLVSNALHRISVAENVITAQSLKWAKEMKDTFNLTEDISTINKKAAFSRIDVNTPQNIKSKIEAIGDFLKIKPDQFKFSLFKNLYITGLTENSLIENIKGNAAILNMKMSEIAPYVIKFPQLMGRNPESVNKSIDIVSNHLGLKRSEYIQAIKNFIPLISRNGENLTAEVDKTANYLGVDIKRFGKCFKMVPSISCLKVDTIKSNVEEISKGLNVHPEDYKKAAVKFPMLLVLKPSNIMANVKGAAKVLNVDERQYTQIIMKVPSLFCMKPERIKYNISELAKAFGCAEQELIEIGVRYPQLLYAKPATVAARIEQGAKLMNMPKDVYFELAKANPSIFVMSPETILKRSDAAQFFKAIKGERVDSSVIKFSTNTVDNSYFKSLSVLLNNYDDTANISFKDSKTLIPEYIADNANRTFNLSIPKHKLSHDFIDFVTKLSKEITGKDIFNITIKTINKLR